MIETAELKGTQIGGAAVSTKHANFIVAGPAATATDVLALIRLVQQRVRTDRKSTRLNSSHLVISYAVFCLKKKNNYIAATNPSNLTSILLVQPPTRHSGLSAITSVSNSHDSSIFTSFRLSHDSAPTLCCAH